MVDPEAKHVRSIRCAKCGKMFTGQWDLVDAIKCCLQEEDDCYIAELNVELAVPVDEIEIGDSLPSKIQEAQDNVITTYH